MKHSVPWFLTFVVAALTACADSVAPTPRRDVFVVDTLPSDDVVPLADGVIVDDVPPSPDVVTAKDVAPSTDKVIFEDVPPIDVVTIADAPTVIDGPVATDGSTVTDVATTPDAPLETDVPVATDVATPCPNGLSDRCPPAGTTSSCADLADGRPRTLVFTGLTSGLAASCEGTQSSMGPDGVVPLTLTRTSDVVITSAPTAGDVSVVSIYRVGGCGVLAQELACANSSIMGGSATLRVSSLPAGVYYVQVAAVRGAATTVTAILSPARPRTNGDVCPGIVVRPDMGPVIQSTMGYQVTNDYGTTCASGSGGGASTSSHDAVFTFTTTEARDVTVEVSATGGSIVSMELTRSCGDRATAIVGCVNGNPASRTFRNLAAGTYFITVAANGQRTLIANVTTTAPVPPPAGDTCPGVALGAGTAAMISLSGLTPGITSLACAPALVGDGAFGFTAPATGNDVLVNVTTSSGRFGMQLQRPCGGTNVGVCVGANEGTRSIWQRYTGLSAGEPHAIVVGTNTTSGTMTARYLTVPTPSISMVSNNFSCMNPQVIRAPGGIFRGNNAMSGTRTGSTITLRPGCIPVGCFGGRAVFYRLELTARQRVIATATGFDTTLWIATGTSCPGTANPMACNDDRLGMAAQIDTTLDAGTYWLVLSGCGPMAEGTYTLDVATITP